MNDFIYDLIIRALKTTCQSAVSILILGAVWSDIDFYYLISASTLAGAISLLMNIQNIPLKGGDA